ncbi:MAG TPA: zinc ABC transporter substrate-binding protein [Prolixibacteraceae bacterium]|nr:zinc ABC transporter substrate-binding protein [Prolixibacteraceae bacterium]
MKKIFVLTVVSAILFACNPKKKTDSESEKPVITVSIIPQKTFVEKIGGDDFYINVLVPPGASPAAYTLLPSQLKDISKSDVWFRVGYIGFEHSWKDKIMQANEEMKVVDLSEGLDLIADKQEQHGDHVHFQGVDPHIWLSPKLVKQMAKKILVTLSDINPGQASVYQSNYSEFIKEIDQLNVELKTKLRPYKGRKILVFHPSLSYFARDYDLEQFALESGGKEPTPKHMATAVDLAKQENLDVIYIQSEFDRDHAGVIAEAINGWIIQVRPLDPAWAENLREITAIFIDNFK